MSTLANNQFVNTTLGSASADVPPNESAPPPDELLKHQVTGSGLFGRAGGFAAAGPCMSVDPVWGPVTDLNSFAPGGCAENPLGFPGYRTLYGRTLATYWWMLQHPIVRISRANLVDPMLASTWTYEKSDEDFDDAEADELEKLLRRNLNPLRFGIVEHCARGRDFGRAPFEPVWDLAAGEWRLVDMVPLAIETTGVYRDAHGRFAGLAVPLVPGTDLSFAQIGISDQNLQVPGLPAPYKSWLYLYDDYARQLTGRSWLENIRDTAWKDWLDAAQQLQKLGAKTSGIFSVIIGPSGNIPGTTTSYRESCSKLIEAMGKQGAVGGYIARPTIPIDNNGSVDLLKLLVQYTKDGMIDFKQLDFGNTAPAIMGILERMKHAEQLMYMGNGQASRTGLEGQHGARAETQTKSDTGKIVSEVENDGIARQIQPLIDAILVLNKGEKYRGVMRCKCPPLEPQKLSTQVTIFQSLLSSRDSALALETIRVLDIDKFFREADFNLLRSFNPDNVAADAATAKPMDLTGQQQGDGTMPATDAGQAVGQITNRVSGLLDNAGRPNGNGKSNGAAK